MNKLYVEDTCTCSHILIRMECYKCGYPASEAEYLDDGSNCGCISCKESNLNGRVLNNDLG